MPANALLSPFHNNLSLIVIHVHKNTRQGLSQLQSYTLQLSSCLFTFIINSKQRKGNIDRESHGPHKLLVYEPEGYWFMLSLLFSPQAQGCLGFVFYILFLIVLHQHNSAICKLFIYPLRNEANPNKISLFQYQPQGNQGILIYDVHHKQLNLQLR